MAIGCYNLLESQDLCDMQFIVIDPHTPLSTDPTFDTDNPLAKEPIENGSIIKAHRYMYVYLYTNIIQCTVHSCFLKQQSMNSVRLL